LAKLNLDGLEPVSEDGRLGERIVFGGFLSTLVHPNHLWKAEGLGVIYGGGTYVLRSTFLERFLDPEQLKSNSFAFTVF